MAENSSPSTRDSYYDNLRLFLMFTVVLVHSLQDLRGTSYVVASLHDVLLSFCMPLFVFLTGFFAKGMTVSGSPKRMRILNYAAFYVLFQSFKIVWGGTRPS